MLHYETLFLTFLDVLRCYLLNKRMRELNKFERIIVSNFSWDCQKKYEFCLLFMAERAKLLVVLKRTFFTGETKII